MARYNEVLVGRFAQSVQKLFGIKGEVPVASLAGEISVTHSFASGRENCFLENWRTFGTRQATNAVAAQNSVILFRNPAGTNIIAVIESYKIVNFSAAVMEVFTEFSVANPANISGTITPAFFDSRFNPPATGNNGAACQISAANNIATPNMITFEDQLIPTNTTTNEMVNFENQEIVLLPGSAMQVRSVQLNVALGFNVRWRERFLEEQERA